MAVCRISTLLYNFQTTPNCETSTQLSAQPMAAFLTMWLNNKMAILNVGGSCLMVDSQTKSTGLVWGLVATWHWVCIHYINRVTAWWQHYYTLSWLLLLLYRAVTVTVEEWWTRNPAKASGGRPYETGSRNMAATQKINFLTPVSYSLLQTVTSWLVAFCLRPDELRQSIGSD